MDVRTYNSIVDEWADRLFRFAYSMCKNKDDANDVVQDAFTKLWEKKDTVNEAKVKSYLFTTAHHKMIDMFRRGNRFGEMDKAAMQLSYTPVSHDLQAVLQEALNKLPEIQKSVVLLRDYEGYSYEEIAEITALSLSQVKVYIFRARQSLKTYIGQLDLVI